MKFSITGLLDKYIPGFNYDFLYNLWKCKFKNDLGNIGNLDLLKLLWDLLFGKIDLEDFLEKLLDNDTFAAFLERITGGLVSVKLIDFIKAMYELLTKSSGLVGSLSDLLDDILAFLKALVLSDWMTELFNQIMNDLITLLRKYDILGLENILVAIFNALAEELIFQHKENLSDEFIKFICIKFGLTNPELTAWVIATWRNLENISTDELLPSVLLRIVREQPDSVKEFIYDGVKTAISKSSTTPSTSDLPYLIASVYRSLLTTHELVKYKQCVDKGFYLEKFVTIRSRYPDPIVTAIHVANLKRVYNELLKPISDYYKPILKRECVLHINYGLVSPEAARGLIRGSLRDSHVSGMAVDFQIIGITTVKLLSDLTNGKIGGLSYGNLSYGSGVHISLANDPNSFGSGLVINYNGSYTVR